MTDTDIAKESVFDAEDTRQFLIGFKSIPERLDKALARLMPEHSRTRIQGWIEDGHVSVNDKEAQVRQMLLPGDRVVVRVQPSAESTAFLPEDIPLTVIAESNDWIVIDKPAGLVTHPGAGNWSGTLLNGLLHRYPELASVARAGIVHRLDKDTSGLLVVARNETAQTHLVRQLQAHTVLREYLALVHGHPSGNGRVDTSIGRDPRVPIRRTSQNPVAPKAAVTHYNVLRHGMLPESRRVSEIVCRLETGRTHQIRVHMSSLGHPLLGDTLYGGEQLPQASRQMLHARRLSFQDPGSNEIVTFESQLANDIQALCQEIEWS